MMLAKSPYRDGEVIRTITVEHHTQSVMSAADMVADQFGPHMVLFWQLPVGESTLRRLLKLSAWLHDLGKSNDHFQPYIGNEKPNHQRHPQAIRHESVSLFIASQPTVQQAMMNEFSTPECLAILAAVSSHHSKTFDPRNRKNMIDNPYCRSDLNVLVSDSQFRKMMRDCPLGSIQPPPRIKIQVDEGNIGKVLKFYEDFRQKYNKIPAEYRRLAACIKSCLIVSDVLGSMSDQNTLESNDIDLLGTMRRYASNVMTRTDLLTVVDEQKMVPDYSPRAFQSQCGESVTPITLLIQACGSGKTHASDLWAVNHAEGKKLYVCYPTRDTATTAYQKVNTECCLIHGLVSTEDFDTEREEYVDSFWLWADKKAYCTADTVLGLFAQYRKSVTLAPCLSNAAFVFDEIHSYDSMLFQALLRFLREYKSHCLLMTASLTPWRLACLREVVPGLQEIGDKNREEEEILRYHRLPIDDYVDVAARAYRAGQKVLFIVNTVGRAIEMADEIEFALGVPVLCYHSRYPSARRNWVRNGVLEAFGRKKTGPSITVATQIAQISLDISCDLLITEYAPICDLIQRKGRLNRWGTQVGNFMVIEPPNSRPYKDAELEQAREWLSSLPEHTSQGMLDRELQKITTADPDVILKHTMLDDFDSSAGRIREDALGVDICLPKHAMKALTNPVKYLIRMNIPFDENGNVKFYRWRTVGHLVVPPVDEIHYIDERGARWR